MPLKPTIRIFLLIQPLLSQNLMMFHILQHIYSHSHHNNLMHKIEHQYFLNVRINVSKISTKSTFFYYFNWCFIRTKIHIYKTPLSYVTELFNLLNASFLLIPIKIRLKVAPFALNIAVSFKE